MLGRPRRRLLLVGPLAILALLCVAAPAHAYVYWTQRSGNGAPIGRANLNGTGAKERFITRAGSTGIAVDGAHIYFTGNYTNPGTIGRANLDGTGVNRSYLEPSAESTVGSL